MGIFVSILFCALGMSHKCFVWVPQETPVYGLAACQILGEESAATWLSGHQHWYVKSIRCSPGNSPPHSEDET